MKRHNEEHIVKLAVKRVFDLLGKISLMFAIYKILATVFSAPISVQIFKGSGIAGAFAFGVYYLHSICKMINDHLKLRKSYSREFLDKKAMISYEVGSFWDVVDRYKDDKNKVAIVLGVNNRFCLDDDYLDQTSLIHNYTQILSDTEKDNLEHDLKEKLKEDVIGYDQSNRPIYKNGALYINRITENTHYETALLAMCEPSSEKGTGRFLSTREGLIESFEKLFEQMSDNFTNFTLIMPMIGTQSSGSPLSPEEVAKYFISAFANHSRINQRRLAIKLVVSLYEKDFEKVEDLVKIKKHIDMECDMGTFSYTKLKSEIVKHQNTIELSLK